MAGGWAPDGAVNDQIEASIQDELKRMQQRPVPQGEGLTHCAECEEEIPEARRRAIPGVKLCVDCQSARELPSSYARRHQPPWVEGQPAQVSGALRSGAEEGQERPSALKRAGEGGAQLRRA